MIFEKLKSIQNPYDYLSSKLDQKEFVGREQLIETLQSILEEYKKTAKLKNIVVIGEKSIGKSTLLNRFDQILKDYNFATYYKELPRNAKNTYDEFDFFKELITDIFYRFAPIESSCLDVCQQDIWFSLTEHNFEHSSNYLERKISFATQYANKIKGLEVKFSDKTIQNDMEKIINALTMSEIENIGLAILIDEFQELSENIILLDTLRKLSENLIGLIIIVVGLPSLVSNPVFEKFNRNAVNVTLKSLEKEEILDLVYKPIENKCKLSRFEVQSCFDEKTISDIVNKSDGNPHHIKVLCGKIFDYFQKCKDQSKFVINREVMENVMEYYSGLSEKSRRIKNALETCTPEHLKTFQEIYFYEGLNIRSIILLKLAFCSIQNDQIESIKQSFIEELGELFNLNLFELSNPDLNVEDLKKLSSEELSNVSYHYIGDAIDKLYTSYYYEDLTKKWLKHRGSKKYEDILLDKLRDQLGRAILSKKINIDNFYKISFTSIPLKEINNNDEIIEDYDRLANLNLDTSTKNELKNASEREKVKLVRQLSRKHRLEYPAIIATQFDFSGYFVLIIDLSIKNRKKIISVFYSIETDNEDIKNTREQILDYTMFLNASLEDYMINIDWIYLYFLHRKALANVVLIDLKNESSVLFERTRQRDFENALISAQRISFITTKFKIKFDSLIVGKEIQHYNNYAFCLVNVGLIQEAKEIFSGLQNKYLLSKLNMCYILTSEGKWTESKNELKRILKKFSNQNDKISFLHLIIHHPELPVKHKIVEDIYLLNIVKWNLALIYAQCRELETSVAFSYLKKVKPVVDNEKIIHQRVVNWVNFFLSKSDRLIEKTENILTKAKKGTYLFKDIEKDLSIFRNAHLPCEPHIS